MSEEKKESNVVTGVWRREGEFGVYFSGTVERSKIAEILDRCGEYVTVKVNPLTNSTNERSPDLLVSLTKGMSPEELKAYRESKNK